MVIGPAAAACGGGAGGGAGPAQAGAPDGGTVLVFAAASLTEAVGGLEAAFEDANPGVDVVVSLAGSSSLREQILAGAPADVFVAANLSTMDQVVEAGAVAGEPVVVARNRLQIVVPAGNPGGVSGLEDFADDGLFLGLCAEGVPCGDLARQALGSAGVTPALDTAEPDVRALLTKVAAGELDAGIVYVTDLVASGDDVEGIGIDRRHDVVADYPIAVLAGAPNPAGAAAFVDFVSSPDGRSILADHGFSGP